jgi:hypothetical protein
MNSLSDDIDPSTLSAKIVSVSYGLLLAFLLNIHGILAATIMPGLITGQLNYLLAPASLFVFFALSFMKFLSFRREIIFKNAVILTLTAVSVVVIVIMSSGLLPFSGGTNLLRFVRDLTFLLLIVFAMLWLTESHRAGVVSLRLMARTLVLTSGVVMPLLGLMLVAPVDGRFAGFVHTPTSMANSVLLIFLIAVFSRCGAGYIALSGTVALLVIVMCGTRAPFALFLLFGMLALLTTLSSARRFLVVAPLLLVGAIFAYWLFVGTSPIGAQTSSGVGARVVSAEDLEQGSLQTRVVWTGMLWMDIKESGYWGGFGAGEAERAIGFLPHFDVLRFWYDYSILFVIVMAVILFVGLTKYFDGAKRSNREIVYVFYMMLLVLILSTHNIFQDTAMSVLMATTLVVCGSYLRSIQRLPVLHRPRGVRSGPGGGAVRARFAKDA